MDAATGSFSNAMSMLGKSIEPEVKAFTIWIADISEKLQVWAKANPQTANTIFKVVAGFGALFLVLS